MNNFSIDDLSEVTSFNESGAAQNRAISTTGGEIKKRKPRSSKSTDVTGKFQKTAATIFPQSIPNMGASPTRAINPNINPTNDIPQTEEIPPPRFNFVALEGEDVDGFISLEGLQSFLGTKDGINDGNAARKNCNPILVAGFNLAKELNGQQKPMFSTAIFTDALGADTDTLSVTNPQLGK